MKYSLLSIVFYFIGMQLNDAQPVAKRTLAELINQQEPAWPTILEQIKRAKNHVTVLEKNAANADSALLEAQITTRSPMGAVIYETGGIMIDDGWIRIIGSGSTKLPRQLMRWNLGKSYQTIGQQPSFLLIADDAIGGLFAINAGAIDSSGIGKVFYFSPDNLEWENMNLSYGGFLQFCFNTDFERFYEGNRWKSWRKDVAGLNGDQAFLIYPYLWSKEGRDIEKDTKSPVPIQELWELYLSQKQ